jgi:hypothetical protein
MNNPNISFAFDMACALVYLITAPLVLLVLFGPAIAKGIQKMQDERFGRTANAAKPSRWRLFKNKISPRKNKCPRCEFINDPQDEYCKKCGTRLKIQ